MTGWNPGLHGHRIGRQVGRPLRFVGNVIRPIGEVPTTTLGKNRRDAQEFLRNKMKQ